MAIVALLTDFGEHDWYVASLKATIAGIIREAHIIDICHSIPPGDIPAGAFILSQCWNDFPDGTVFCCVVDPGVGSTRQPIAARELVSGNFYVGPDNGLFSYVVRLSTGHDAKTRIAGFEIRRIINEIFFKEVLSHTFHGRDLFAPAASRLAGGWEFSRIGPLHNRLQASPWPEVELSDNWIGLQVLYVDRFGTLITNLRHTEFGEAISKAQDAHEIILHHGSKECPIRLVNTFSEVNEGEPLCFIGSGGLLEIAVNLGSAAKHFELKAGDTVSLLLK